MNDFPRALSLKGLWGRNTHRRTSKKENLSPRQYQLRKQRPSRFCCLSASAKAPDPMKSIAHQEACTTTTVFDCCNCDASNSTVFGPDCGFGQHKRCEKCKWIFKLDDIRYGFPFFTPVDFVEMQRYWRSVSSIMAVDHSTNGPRHHQDKERRGDDLFHLRPSSADQDNSVEDNLHPLFTDQDPTYWVCCNCSTKVGPEAATPCRTCGHYYCPSCAIFYSCVSPALLNPPPLLFPQQKSISRIWFEKFEIMSWYWNFFPV